MLSCRHVQRCANVWANAWVIFIGALRRMMQALDRFRQSLAVGDLF